MHPTFCTGVVNNLLRGAYQYQKEVESCSHYKNSVAPSKGLKFSSPNHEQCYHMASPGFTSVIRSLGRTLKQGSKRMEQITPQKPSPTTSCSNNQASICSTKRTRERAVAERHSAAIDYAAHEAKKQGGQGRLQEAYQEKHPSPPMRRYSTGLVMRGGSSTLRSAMWGPPAGLAAAEADSSAAATATTATTAAAAAGGDPIAARSFWNSPLRGARPLNPSWKGGLRWGGGRRGGARRRKKVALRRTAKGEEGGGFMRKFLCYPFCLRFYC